MIPAFAKAPPFSHKTMHGELQCDVYSISYVLLHKKRLLCLRRFLIIMRRTNISNFSFLISHSSKVSSTIKGQHAPGLPLFKCPIPRHEDVFIKIDGEIISQPRDVVDSRTGDVAPGEAELLLRKTVVEDP